MPKIPQYGASQVSSTAPGNAAPTSPRSIADPRPTQNYLPSDSFGVADINPTAEGNAMRNAGQGMSILGAGLARFSERLDATAAEEALIKFERDKNNRFFNPENGYFNSQGRDAYERAEPTLEELQDARRSYADELKSPRAREMFDQAVERQLLRDQVDIDRHASAQFRAYETSIINARVEQSLDNAVLHWDDPEAGAVQLELGRQSILDLAVINGEAREVTANTLRNFDSRFGMATVEAALANGANAAQVALADNMELLEPADLIKMQDRVDRQFQIETEARQSQAALVMASTLVEQHGDAPNARQMILDEVRGLEELDPALADKVRRESLTRLTQYQEAKSEERAVTYEAAEGFMLQGGTVDQFISQNPEGWSKLTPAQQKTLLKPEPIVTDFAIYSRLMTLPPAELAKVDPNDYVNVLAPTDRQRLLTAVSASRKGDTSTLPTMQSLTAKTTAAAEQLFGESTTWKSAKKHAQVAGFMALVESEAAYRTREKGATLTPTEYNVLLNDMTRQMVVERDWALDIRNYGIDDIEVPADMARDGYTPTDYMLEISDLLHQQGLPVTADNILRVHDNQKKK